MSREVYQATATLTLKIQLEDKEKVYRIYLLMDENLFY